jgi:hypothetical protein
VQRDQNIGSKPSGILPTSIVTKCIEVC